MNTADIVERAECFAATYHKQQKRILSGELYTTHTTAVAHILQTSEFDEFTVAAGHLHDVSEDCAVEISKIEHVFGSGIAALVAPITYDPLLATRSEQRARYCERITTPSIAAIALADKRHNIADVLLHLNRGIPAFARLEQNSLEQIKWWRRVLATARRFQDDARIARLLNLVEQDISTIERLSPH